MREEDEPLCALEAAIAALNLRALQETAAAVLSLYFFSLFSTTGRVQEDSATEQTIELLFTS